MLSIQSQLLGNVTCSSVLKIFDHQTGIILWVKNKYGIYHYANQEYLRHYFLSGLEDIVGKTDYDFAPKYLADSFLADDQLVLNGEEIHNRLELISFHDEMIDWYMTDKLPIKDENGNILGTIGITRKVENIKGPQVPDNSLLKIMTYIKDNFAEKVSVVEMAEISCLSVSAFERKFKKYFKMTPIEYILKYRINQVCRALAYTNKSISEIALDCGFCDHSYMTRQFKKIMKCSPTEFRARYS